MKKAKDDINYFTLEKNETVYGIFHHDKEKNVIIYSHINYTSLTGNKTISLKFYQETKYSIKNIIEKIKIFLM